MANKEHLKIFRLGLLAWNKWRNENREITPELSGVALSQASLVDADLSGADLSGADLSGANLIGANLVGANLVGANLIAVDLRDANLSDANLSDADLSDAKLSNATLSDANLMGASLIGANLIGANLIDATLSETDLSEANLNGANLSGADLLGADLSHANLRETNLSGIDFSNTKLGDAIFSKSNLSKSNLSKTILIGADLSEANLSEANLSGADLLGADLNETKLMGANLSKAALSRADLSGASLISADLSEANLSEANLSDANLSDANLKNARLQTARLISAKLDGANLSGICLWETQRAGWLIKGVICESVYWDKNADIQNIYSPGDFERLFADKTKIRLFFKDGISPLEVATLPALIKHLQDAHPGCSLRLVNIHDDSGGAVVELAIEGDDEQSPQQTKQLQAALEAEAQQRIEYQRQALVEREARLQLEGEVKQLDSVVDKLIRHHAINIHQGGRMGDKYEISGQAGAVGPNAHAHDMTFNQIVNHVEQNIDLVMLAKQLSELRQVMTQKQDASPQAAIAIGEVAKAEIAAAEKNTSKVVEHLKAAGKWTMDFAKEIGKELVVDVIKKATGML